MRERTRMRAGKASEKASNACRPCAPMSWAYLDRLASIGVDPDAVLVTAGKSNRMDTGLVDNGNFQIAARRHADNLIPFHRLITSLSKQKYDTFGDRRFDLDQDSGHCGPVSAKAEKVFALSSYAKSSAYRPQAIAEFNVRSASRCVR